MSEQLPTIGYVGVGLMGLPMVKRLVSLGYPVRAFDILPAQVQAAQDAGAIAASSPADAAREADFVMLNLPTTEAVEQAVFGEAGAGAAEDVARVAPLMAHLASRFTHMESLVVAKVAEDRLHRGEALTWYRCRPAPSHL